MKNDYRRSKTNCLKAATLLLVLSLSGCATAPTETGDGAVVIPTSGSGYSIVRKTAGVSQAVYISANSFYVNPIFRPVTHVASISSYLLKSSGGAARRMAIAHAQMPQLQGPVPAIAYNDPMDLEDWERQLDRVTRTRQKTPVTPCAYCRPGISTPTSTKPRSRQSGIRGVSS
jgi:hypothetical protein